MHEARFNYLATKHAMSRAIVSVTNTKEKTIATLECGHVSEHAPHFSIKVGETVRCYDCGAHKVKSENMQ